MKTRIVQTCACVITSCVLGSAALAQAQPCADREKVVDRLTNTYGETVQSMGLGANNGMMEVFASEETGSWTITVTMPDGQTCLIASGQAFEGLDGSPTTLPGDDV
ncbi:hypothetical protein [Tropicimonas sp. S265A]|uniref:hypothetical protein n=1 Tax=Tropicimonas sp. S265A TaxID=3415134 RepID=UPI003C7D451C